MGRRAVPGSRRRTRPLGVGRHEPHHRPGVRLPGPVVVGDRMPVVALDAVVRGHCSRPVAAAPANGARRSPMARRSRAGGRRAVHHRPHRGSRRRGRHPRPVGDRGARPPPRPHRRSAARQRPGARRRHRLGLGHDRRRGTPRARAQRHRGRGPPAGRLPVRQGAVDRPARSGRHALGRQRRRRHRMDVAPRGHPSRGLGPARAPRPSRLPERGGRARASSSSTPDDRTSPRRWPPAGVGSTRRRRTSRASTRTCWTGSRRSAARATLSASSSARRPTRPIRALRGWPADRRTNAMCHVRCLYGVDSSRNVVVG